VPSLFGSVDPPILIVVFFLFFFFLYLCNCFLMGSSWTAPLHSPPPPDFDDLSSRRRPPLCGNDQCKHVVEITSGIAARLKSFVADGGCNSNSWCHIEEIRSVYATPL
jgi:hypothetical protein